MIRTRAAVVVAALAAAMARTAVAPASAAGHTSAAPKCKKGTILVKTGRKKRCVKLRVAPPPPKAADRGRLALDFLLSSKWPALRDRRGRRVPSLAKRLRQDGPPRRAGASADVRQGARARGSASRECPGGERPRAWAARACGPSRRRRRDRGLRRQHDRLQRRDPAGDVTIFVEFRTRLGLGSHRGRGLPDGRRPARGPQARRDLDQHPARRARSPADLGILGHARRGEHLPGPDGRRREDRHPHDRSRRHRADHRSPAPARRR